MKLSGRETAGWFETTSEGSIDLSQINLISRTGAFYRACRPDGNDPIKLRSDASASEKLRFYLDREGFKPANAGGVTYYFRPGVVYNLEARDGRSSYVYVEGVHDPIMLVGTTLLQAEAIFCPEDIPA